MQELPNSVLAKWITGSVSGFESLTICACDFVLLSVLFILFLIFVVVVDGVYLNSYVHQTHPLHIIIIQTFS